MTIDFRETLSGLHAHEKKVLLAHKERLHHIDNALAILSEIVTDEEATTEPTPAALSLAEAVRCVIHQHGRPMKIESIVEKLSMSHLTKL